MIPGMQNKLENHQFNSPCLLTEELEAHGRQYAQVVEQVG